MARVYVGNLPDDVKRSEIEDLFGKYGRIRDIDIKVPRSGPAGLAFAFVEFDDERDAEDSVRGRDGEKFAGERLRVEVARGGRRDGGRGPSGAGGSRGPPKHSDYRVIVTGLPSGTSWQDLKDHMRQAGDVGFAEVTRDGTGIVEYSNEDDMKYAIRKLDDSKFTSPYSRGEGIIRVKEDRPSGGGRDRSRDRSRDRGRSRSRSPRRRSPSPRKASRSRSPASPRKDD